MQAASPAGAKAAVFGNKFEAVLTHGLPTAVARYLETDGNTNTADRAATYAFLQGAFHFLSQPRAMHQLSCKRHRWISIFVIYFMKLNTPDLLEGLSTTPDILSA